MTPGVPTQPPEIAATLTSRCRALRLPAWTCDRTGAVTAGPGPFGTSDALLGSEALQQLVTDAARTFIDAVDPQPLACAAGCSLVPVVHALGIRRTGCHVVWLLTEEALAGAWFGSLCAAAGVSAASMADALRAEVSGITGPCHHDPQQIKTVLGWAYADLQRESEDRQSIDEFCHKLLQSYEEVNLIYRMSASMKCLPDPGQMMQATCEDLVDALPFQWAASVFDKQIPLVPDLAGRVIHGGELPGGRKLFTTQARRELAGDWPEATGIRLNSDGPLAAMVGSQIVSTPIMLGEKVVAVLIAGGKSGQGDDREVCAAEMKMLKAAADLLSVFMENAAAFHEQRTLFMGTLRALTATIDAKDQYTRGHSERVALLGRQLALAAGMTDGEAHLVHVAGLMHDVGKIGVPEHVLGKAGRLDDAEFDLIKQHPVIGHRILRDIPQLSNVLDGVLYHHERFDGRGYPEGLAGKRIPSLGRLLAVCDTFDAMSSTRAYRSAMPRHEVLAEIKRSAGTQLDPELVAHFLTLDLAEYDAALSQHLDASRLAA